MSENAGDFTGNVERFTGFADVYDRYRPGPPTALADSVLYFAGLGRPRRVVDLGSGTGLSTRYWAAHADEVVGIEPSADMRRQAELATPLRNVSYREGFSHATGLDDRCAQVVSCSQSLHWMEPAGTFGEVARILEPGGVFAACDYDWPPMSGSWEADAAFQVCVTHNHEVHGRESDPPALRRWEKSSHLERMRVSGVFRYTREFLLHFADEGDAERLVGLALSQGGVQTLRKQGVSDDALGLTSLRAIAERTLGRDKHRWLWSARVRVGIV